MAPASSWATASSIGDGSSAPDSHISSICAESVIWAILHDHARLPPSQRTLENLDRPPALVDRGHEGEPDIPFARRAEEGARRHHHADVEQPRREALGGLA